MNFQLEQENIISKLDHVPTLLLHSCCGPCSSHCLEVLSKHFSVTVLWYNPNIQPAEEFNLRLQNQEKLLKSLQTQNPVKLLVTDYNPNEFFEVANGLEEEKEGGARCEKCFRLRLEKTAQIAKESGFEFFTTTLTVSPHKNAELLNQLGYEIAEKYGINFLPADFKKKNGYKRSIELSKQFDLYRQNYCGCVYSKWE
ncbi:MAG: epoxyqueuosine reductase QueH [Clostridia bacterium]|nr:epoxyqueuosine reductase QueH [Clostridia bacterium]